LFRKKKKGRKEKKFKDLDAHLHAARKEKREEQASC